MSYPPQGVGISEFRLIEILGEERRKTRKWRIISLILGVLALIEPFLFIGF